MKNFIEDLKARCQNLVSQKPPNSTNIEQYKKRINMKNNYKDEFLTPMDNKTSNTTKTYNCARTLFG